MKLSLIVASVVLSACTINMPDPAPQPSPGGGSSVGQDPPAQSQKVACGEVLTQCNCDRTQAYPGLVAQASKCESGFQIYDTCGYCGTGGYAWYSACYCED